MYSYGSNWATQGFFNPMGSASTYSEAKEMWKREGYDLLPDGTKVKLGGGGGAPAAAAPVGGNINYTVDSTGKRTYSGLTQDQLTSIADPWASQRGQYQKSLSDLMSNPDQFTNSALFKSATNAGIDAVNRSAASKGMLQSGNRLQALMDYGTQQAPKTFFQMADLLSGLGGAKNQNPGGGLQAAASLQNADTSAFNAQTARDQQVANVNKQISTDTLAAKQQQQQNQMQLDALSKWQQQQQQQNQQAEWDRQNNYWNTWGQGAGPSYL